jgi:hypothetical protein
MQVLRSLRPAASTADCQLPTANRQLETGYRLPVSASFNCSEMTLDTPSSLMEMP